VVAEGPEMLAFSSHGAKDGDRAADYPLVERIFRMTRPTS
jgi:hypothetical protein